MRFFVRFRSPLLLVLILAANSSWALSVGQISDFSGSAEGWTAGGGLGMGVPPFPPVSTTDMGGGPGGLADEYLLITSTGDPVAGGKMTAINFAPWAGDYLSEGIGSISMHVNNFGADDLHLRLLFFGAGGAEIAITTSSIIGAGSGWTPITFDIDPLALIPLVGTAAGALAATDALRIYHSPGISAPAGVAPLAGMLGVDNITANPVPLPGAVWLMLSGLGAVGWRSRKRR